MENYDFVLENIRFHLIEKDTLIFNGWFRDDNPDNRKIEVYLDESLKRFDTVYPAAGDDHSAVKLTIPELEQAAEAFGWVDVCKEPEQES